jgi:hypothetical protein
VLCGDIEGAIPGKEVSTGKEANKNCTPEIGHEQSWENGKGNSFRPPIKENFWERNLDQWINEKITVA